MLATSLTSSISMFFGEGILVGLDFLAFFPEGSDRGGDLDLDLADGVQTETKLTIQLVIISMYIPYFLK